MGPPMGSKPRSVLVRDGRPGGEGPVERDADTGAGGPGPPGATGGKRVPKSPWGACGPDKTLTLDVQPLEL